MTAMVPWRSEHENEHEKLSDHELNEFNELFLLTVIRLIRVIRG